MPYASLQDKKEYDKRYYLQLSDAAKEKRRIYNRQRIRKKRKENPEHFEEIRRRYLARHPNIRKLWNSKRSAEYTIWDAMKQRCYNKNYRSFNNYGGRGIKVYKAWLNSFESFFKDMGPRPSSRHSIDRLNNDGNYEPENCRWATAVEQARNKRSNVFIKYRGKTKCLMEWSIETGIAHETLRRRIKRGLAGKELFGEVDCRR